MAPIKVHIIYDKPTPDYYAGEVLSGNVVVTLEKPTTINVVSLKVKGKGEVEFIRTEGSGDNKKTVRYHNKEIYFKHQMEIFQSSNATFGYGQNRFPFSIQLPTSLPETFHVKSGEVKYKCKTIVKCGESVNILSSTIKESMPFNVHAVVPLPNHLREMQRTQEIKNLPLFCDACCCFSSGKVTGALTIDKGGYIPGETISFNAQISNKTTSNLESITLSLKQTTQCISKEGKADTIHNEINKVACPQGLRAGADFSWPVSLALPYMLPPTNLGTCRIITVSYMLEADVGEESGCCSPDVHFRIPFMVCTAAPSMMPNFAQAGTMATAQTQQPSAYAGFPQPLAPGYPPTQPGGYPPGQPGGYPPGQPGGYPPNQPGGYPPNQPGGYPPNQPGGYAPIQPGGFPTQPDDYPPPMPGGFPKPPGGFPPTQPGCYLPTQPGGYPPTQPGGYPPTQPGGYPPAMPEGYPSTQPNMMAFGGYPSPQQQIAGFEPSCPDTITDK